MSFKIINATIKNFLIFIVIISKPFEFLYYPNALIFSLTKPKFAYGSTCNNNSTNLTEPFHVNKNIVHECKHFFVSFSQNVVLSSVVIPIILTSLIIILSQIIIWPACIAYFKRKCSQNAHIEAREFPNKKEMFLNFVNSVVFGLIGMVFVWWPLFGPIYRFVYSIFTNYFFICSMAVDNCTETHKDFVELKDIFNLFSKVNDYQIYAVLIGAPFVVAFTFLHEYK